jgi:hypothetical protein
MGSGAGKLAGKHKEDKYVDLEEAEKVILDDGGATSQITKQDALRLVEGIFADGSQNKPELMKQALEYLAAECYQGEPYNRLLVLSGASMQDASEEVVCFESLAAARALRKKYIGCVDRVHGEATSYKASTKFEYSMEHGIIQVLADGKPCFAASRIGFAEYKADYDKLCSIVTDGMVKTLCHNRLLMLEKKYELHHHMNSHVEANKETSDKADMYTAHKVTPTARTSVCKASSTACDVGTSCYPFRARRSTRTSTRPLRSVRCR